MRHALVGILAMLAVSAASAADHPALTLLDGDRVAVDDYQGKSVLLNFWATWCGPCRKEMPELSQMSELLDPDKAVILGVAADEQADVAAYVEQLPVAYPIAVGDPDGLFAWSAELGNVVQALPFSVLLDESGAPIWAKLGELEFDELETVMHSYMSESEAGQ